MNNLFDNAIMCNEYTEVHKYVSTKVRTYVYTYIHTYLLNFLRAKIQLKNITTNYFPFYILNIKYFYRFVSMNE